MAIEMTRTICWIDQIEVCNLPCEWSCGRRARQTKLVQAVFNSIMTWFRRYSTRLGRVFVRDRYRPETHYMRGPGPKTLEKARREAARQ